MENLHTHAAITAMSTNPTVEDLEAAELAVAEAVAAAAKYGPRIGSIRFADGALNAVIRTVAGKWSTWCCMALPRLSGANHRRFVGEYAALVASRTAPPKQRLARLVADDAHAPVIVVRSERRFRYSAVLDHIELQERIKQLQTSR